jgi:hypothetical protein
MSADSTTADFLREQLEKKIALVTDEDEPILSQLRTDPIQLSRRLRNDNIQYTAPSTGHSQPARASENLPGETPVNSKENTQIRPLSMSSSYHDAGNSTSAVESSSRSPVQEYEHLTPAPSELKQHSRRDHLASTHDLHNGSLQESYDLEYEIMPSFMSEDTFNESLEERDPHSLEAATDKSGLRSAISTTFDAGWYIHGTNRALFC